MVGTGTRPGSNLETFSLPKGKKTRTDDGLSGNTAYYTEAKNHRSLLRAAPDSVWCVKKQDGVFKDTDNLAELANGRRPPTYYDRSFLLFNLKHAAAVATKNEKG